MSTTSTIIGFPGAHNLPASSKTYGNVLTAGCLKIDNKSQNTHLCFYLLSRPF